MRRGIDDGLGLCLELVSLSVGRRGLNRNGVMICFACSFHFVV